MNYFCGFDDKRLAVKVILGGLEKVGKIVFQELVNFFYLLGMYTQQRNF